MYTLHFQPLPKLKTLSTTTAKMSQYSPIIFTLIGFSSSAILWLPTFKRQQKRRFANERLKMIHEALEQSEDRVARFQERHDRLLSQVCSYYLCHRDLEEALVGARKAANEELEFAASLRKMQQWVLSSYPDHVDLVGALS